MAMPIKDSLRRFRKRFKLSQGDLAKRLGMMQQSYYRYENGQTVPRADDIVKLAGEFKVTTDYILGLSDDPQPTNFDEKEVKAAFEARDKYLQLRDILGMPPQITA